MAVSLIVSLTVLASPPRHWTAYAYPPSFEHLSVQQGLSQATVHAILQDHQGFLWFGTEDGLNRYDGFRFRAFRHEHNDPASLGANWISCLCEDSRQRLWVGTFGGGLNSLDRTTLSIQALPAVPFPRGLPSADVTALLEDPSGNLWIGTADSGLCVLPAGRMPPAQPQFLRFLPQASEPGALPGLGVACLFMDRSKTLWVGLEGGGLCRLVPGATLEGTTFAQVPARGPAPPEVTSMGEDALGVLWLGTHHGLYSLAPDRTQFQRVPRPGNGLVTTVFQDRARNLWIGGEGAGLDRLLPRTGPEAPARFRHFCHEDAKAGSLSANTILAIQEDRSGVLWFGTRLKGLDKLCLNPAQGSDPEQQALHQFRNEPLDRFSLSGNAVNAICEDRFGHLWVGTDGYGLNRVVPPPAQDQPLRFEAYRARPESPGALQDDVITCLYLDSRKRLWAGSYTGGLIRVELSARAGATPHFTHFKPVPGSAGRLDNYILSLGEDASHRLWVATGKGGLSLFDEGRKTFLPVQPALPLAPEFGPGNPYFSMAADAQGTLWLGNPDGLDRFNPATGAFKAYRAKDLPGSLGYSSVDALAVDPAGVLWVATQGGGLDRATIPPWDGPAPRFTHLGAPEGFPGDAIVSLLGARSQGPLWAASSHAIYRVEPGSGKASPFIREPALAGNEFLRTSAYMNACGEVLLGGTQGLSLFHPDDLAPNLQAPAVVFTDFRLANQSVAIRERINGKVILDRAITEAQGITLSPDEFGLTFEFAALHFGAPARNRYAYCMEGLNGAWIDLGNRHFITYTSLPPGEYTLRVKAANADGVWSPVGASLKVHVVSPWRNGWWLWTGAGLAAVLALAWSAYRKVLGLRRRNRALKAAEDFQAAW